MTDKTADDIAIDAVFFAQAHVQQPHQPYFRLVGDRDTLIKAHVVSPSGTKAPPVTAELSLDGDRKRLVLEGPATLPRSLQSEPGKVEHRFADSFTAMIPAEWVRRGLRVSVTAGDRRHVIDDLAIGAPIRIPMTVLDIHYFGYEDADYPGDWVNELFVKRRIARLDVQRIPRILFPELVVPPRAGLPAVRCTCTDDYQVKTGTPFNGKQAAALQWQGALQRAGGQCRLTLFYISIANVPSGGEAWAFGGVGKLGRLPLFHHELGHAFSVAHLCDEPHYPYRGTMHGIPGPDGAEGPHVGPTWGFDPRPGLPGAEPGKPFFISPVIPANTVRGQPGTWKNEPQAGASAAHEPGHLLTMYSDWSLHKMQAYAEQHVVYWSDERQAYVTWDDETAMYSKPIENDGVSFPVERDVEVFSIIASISAVTAEANFVYRPVGPYVSGLIDRFDPGVAEDRARFRKAYGKEGRCDVSLRIVQGGKTQTFMLPLEWRPDDDPLARASLHTAAVNVPVRDGEVTAAELLLTPDAVAHGLPADPRTLYRWG